MKGYSLRAIAVLCLAAALPAAAFASEFRTGDAPAHPKSEIALSDLYMFGGSVSSAGTVRGDLVTFGGNIQVSGPVAGDVIAGGGNVSVTSDIGDDVRIGGGTVTIQGAVAGDVIAAGGQLTITSAKIGGDLVAAGGALRIDAPVAGNATLAGSDVRIDSEIKGDVLVQAEKLTLGPKAHIFGALTYKAPMQATLESGAVVTGETKYTKSPDVREAAKLGLIAFFSVWFVAKMFMVFSGALVVGYVFQRYAAEFVARATGNAPYDFLRGLIFFIVTPIVSVLLLFTVIGIAFGALGLLAFAAMMIYGTMLAPLLLGSWVFKQVFKQREYEISWKTILTGTLLFFIIGLIPFIGILIEMCIVLISIGAALSIKGKILNEWR